MTDPILIVEDERDLVQSLEFNLQQQGYDTLVALDGQSALDALDDARPALVVLDLMLPDMSGIEICRRIRSDDELGDLPVLILTARGEEIDRITGFEAGADDYVVKPFCVDELMLRVQAILRRSQPNDDDTDEIRFGELYVDFAAHQVSVAGSAVELTPLEFCLLKVLMTRRGRTQSREVLLRDVWDIDADVMTRTVDTHMQRLRAKLGPCGEYIVTVRGVGYRFLDESP